jgi:hypothetical protein
LDELDRAWLEANPVHRQHLYEAEQRTGEAWLS